MVAVLGVEQVVAFDKEVQHRAVQRVGMTAKGQGVLGCGVEQQHPAVCVQLTLAVGVLPYAVTVGGVGFETQARPGGEGDVEVGFVSQVFEGVGGNHVARVAVDVAERVAAAYNGL